MNTFVDRAGTGVKRSIQLGVRRLHLLTAPALPERLGVYFHDLPRERWDRFEEAVRYLSDSGYRFAGPAELCDGQGRTVHLSFDDNFRSWHQGIDLLSDLGVTATFYVNTEPMRDLAPPEVVEAFFTRIGRSENESLTVQELQELAIAGHNIGAHTHSHRMLSDLSLEDAHREIRFNKQLLEEYLGRPVVDFSYPFGMRRHFSEDLRTFCLDSGFETIANAIPGLQHAGHRRAAIQRTGWNLNQPLAYNLDNLRIDGRRYERFTGRSATGP